MRLMPLALAFVAVSVIGATAAELPVRKPGRWELKTVMDEGGQKHEQMIVMCIDAEMERNTAAAAEIEHRTSCTKYDVQKSDDKIVVEAVCKMNGRDVQSRTEMSGDFQDAFEVKIDSTTSGTDGAQSVSIKRTIDQTGKYLGAECGELKAGEAMGTDGTKIMVQ